MTVRNDETGFSDVGISLSIRTPPEPIICEMTKKFLKDVIAGLSANPKTLPSKYFYDDVGAKLFEKICTLPEYYVTRVEKSILETHAGAIGVALGARTLLVEYGAGSLEKIRILLAKMDDPAGVIAVDISESQLLEAAHLR